VLVLGFGALGLWLELKTTLVSLLLLYYNGITQFAPAFFFGFFWKRVTVQGVATGLVAGVTLAVFFAARGIQPFGINPGFLALVANVTLAVVVSLLTERKEPAG